MCTHKHRSDGGIVAVEAKEAAGDTKAAAALAAAAAAAAAIPVEILKIKVVMLVVMLMCPIGSCLLFAEEHQTQEIRTVESWKR